LSVLKTGTRQILFSLRCRLSSVGTSGKRETLLSLKKTAPPFKGWSIKFLQQQTPMVYRKEYPSPRIINLRLSTDRAIAWFDGATQSRGKKCGAGGKISLNKLLPIHGLSTLGKDLTQRLKFWGPGLL
jgi:hypothetical protein